MQKMQMRSIQMGADPEFFFTRKGKVIGSEKVIDIKQGLKVSDNIPGTSTRPYGNLQSKFIVDGVQAELNPKPDTCRARFGNEISACFRELYKQIEADRDLKASFAPAVKVTQEELDTLDEKSKVFGCGPSKNADKESENSAAKIKDPGKYLYRGAGGHIHISASSGGTEEAVAHSERLVAILDILVGNTCVLIDRDEMNIIRRKTYGRAGEYRTPSHGLEYRVLSNFWLRAYPLTSFVMGMTRLSVSVMANTFEKPQEYNTVTLRYEPIALSFEEELLKLVNMEDIRKAINENDARLAMKNFKKIKPFIEKYCGYEFSLNKDNLPYFEYFVKKGLNYWFKEDVMQHWIKLPDGHTCGWESFLLTRVKKSKNNKIRRVFRKLINRK